MIRASLTDENGEWTGNWGFQTAPRIGEQIVLGPDRYHVTMLEHWPLVLEQPENDRITLRIYVRSAVAAT